MGVPLRRRSDLPGERHLRRSRASRWAPGPFVLKSYRQGSSIVLTKNPKYWDSKAYPLGGVDFTQVTQGPEAATALTSGAVDMIEVEPRELPAAEERPEHRDLRHEVL